MQCIGYVARGARWSRSMQNLIQSVLQYVASHAAWAGPVMFVAAFAESLAVISVAVPGTAILFAAGALMPHILPPAPILAGAVAGAAVGDGTSYWLGRRFSERIERIWPFTRYPGAIPYGVAFFERHGTKSIFIGRFFGPARATVPLAAGLLRMPPLRFWLVNIASALVWAPAILLLGAAFGETAKLLVKAGDALVLILLLAALLVANGIWLFRWLRR